MLDQRGRPISTPRTFLTDDNGGAIPRRMVHLLRKYLSEIFPDLGYKPFSGTRLCWSFHFYSPRSFLGLTMF